VETPDCTVETDFMKRICIFSLVILGLSSCETQGVKNEKKLKNIRRGMRISEVYKTMGQPDTSRKYSIDSGYFRLIYEAPFASSDNINIFISEYDSTVQYIVDGQ